MPSAIWREDIGKIFVTVFPWTVWLVRFNAWTHSYIVEVLRNFAAAGSLCAIPVNPLFYHKAKRNKSEHHVHWFGGYFHAADPRGAGAFEVDLVFRFPDG